MQQNQKDRWGIVKKQALQGGECGLGAIATKTLSSNKSGEILARFPEAVNWNQSFASTEMSWSSSAPELHERIHQH